MRISTIALLLGLPAVLFAEIKAPPPEKHLANLSEAYVALRSEYLSGNRQEKFVLIEYKDSYQYYAYIFLEEGQFIEYSTVTKAIRYRNLRAAHSRIRKFVKVVYEEAPDGQQVFYPEIPPLFKSHLFFNRDGVQRIQNSEIISGVQFDGAKSLLEFLDIIQSFQSEH